MITQIHLIRLDYQVRPTLEGMQEGNASDKVHTIRFANKLFQIQILQIIIYLKWEFCVNQPATRSV